MEIRKFVAEYISAQLRVEEVTGELGAGEFHFSKSLQRSDVKPAVHKMPSMASSHISPHTERRGMFLALMSPYIIRLRRGAERMETQLINVRESGGEARARPRRDR